MSGLHPAKPPSSASDVDDAFIIVVQGALASATCGAIIQRFERSGAAKPGRVGGGVRPDLKRSEDLGISGLQPWLDVERTLNAAVLSGLTAYVRRYPHVVLAPLTLQSVDRDSGEMRTLEGRDIEALPDAHLVALVTRVLRPGTINLQKYSAGSGGYPYFHSEIYPKLGDTTTLDRVLLWTLYLNDGFRGGETEFLYQARKIEPKTGALLLAPAGFTHTHRGNCPIDRDKFIATGWIHFREAASLYAAVPAQTAASPPRAG